jgi:Killing trait
MPYAGTFKANKPEGWVLRTSGRFSVQRLGTVTYHRRIDTRAIACKLVAAQQQFIPSFFLPHLPHLFSIPAKHARSRVFTFQRGERMAFPTAVNNQITDAVTQANVKVLGDAPALAVAQLYQATAQAMSIAAQNATAAQQNAATLAQAVVSMAARSVLGS